MVHVPALSLRGAILEAPLTGPSEVALSSQSEVSPQIFVFTNTVMALVPPVLLPLTLHLGPGLIGFLTSRLHYSS